MAGNRRVPAHNGTCGALWVLHDAGYALLETSKIQLDVDSVYHRCPTVRLPSVSRAVQGVQALR